ncbi:MAG: carbon-nitrogen hydrolase family protein [Chloroflexi bacterium]|nr:carbon-nitrogen hydrolase family protein [Chloroflexota bacterium]MCL5735877.1 carbon-nitrogen hydrolase family protein [Actinomycetota bacterium]
MKIGLVQLNSTADKAANLAQAEELVARVAVEKADLVLLPENFNHRGTDEENAAAAEPIPGPSSEWARKLACDLGVFVHLGSLIEQRGERRFNTSLVFDRMGDEVARYSKIHLFDVKLPDGTLYYESEAVSPGDQAVTFACEELTFGMVICYDLRFPELFRALVDRGAQAFLVPAAFTVPTGISHWEPLLRARAIENGCYVAACGQWGPSAVGKPTYGHSMVVEPWGVVQTQCREGVGSLTADLDLEYLQSVRRRMPVLKHRRRDLFV